MKKLLFLLSALGMTAPAAADILGVDIDGEDAKATILDSNGVPIGKAIIKRSKKHGLRLSVSVRGLSRGERGVHIHSVGKCEGPGFASAGPHWNPMNKMHGLENPDGSHRGDMPNLLVNRKGQAKLKYDIADAKLKGEGGLLDIDGAAIVIHAKSDDQRTDPSGNSGDRIACGVFLKD